MITPDFQEDKKLKSAIHNLYCSVKDLFKKYSALSLARSKSSNDSDTNYEKFIGVSLIKEGEEFATVNVPILSKSTELNNVDDINHNPKGYFATNDRVDKEVKDIKDPNATFIMENNHVKAAFEKKKDREWFNRNGQQVEKVLSENDLTDELKSKYDESYNKYVKSGVSLSDKEKVTLKFTRNDGTTFDVLIKDEYITTSDEEVHITNLNFDTDTGKIIATVKSWDDVAKKVVNESIEASIDGRYSLLGHTHSISEIANLASELKALKEKDKSQDTTLTNHTNQIQQLETSTSNLDSKLATKVDKVEGMGLSHNDLTDDRVSKLNTAYDNSIKDGTLTYDDVNHSYHFDFVRNDETKLTIPFDPFKAQTNQPLKNIEFNKDTGDLTTTDVKDETESISLDGRYSLLNHTHQITDVTGLNEKLTQLERSSSGNNTEIDNVAKDLDDAVKNINDKLNLKVDKIDGKQLSTNDFTNEYKSKLDGIEANANKYVHPTLIAHDLGLYKISNDNQGHINSVSPITTNDLTPLLNNTYASKADTTSINNQIGKPNGLAILDESGHIPSSQLPSFVDDVLEYDTKSGFPVTGESGKIYIAKDDNKTYRWSGTQYVEISASLTLGTTANTAYAGNLGVALDTKITNHINNQANPHNVTAKQIGISIATTGKAGLIKVGSGLSITADGTLSANIQEVDTSTLATKTELNELNTKTDDYAKVTSAALNNLKLKIISLTNNANLGILSEDTYQIPIPSETTTHYHIGRDVISGVPIYTMSYLYTGSTQCKLTVDTNYTLIKVDGTDTLIGQGSTASVVIVDKKVYLRISNK